MGPAGMNKADVQRIAAETKRILNLPEVKERLSSLGIDANPQGPEALNQLIKQDSKRWSKLIEEAGIKAE
jgi:tripartite-type tricarboxylate transporter receptor subunit TctC